MLQKFSRAFRNIERLFPGVFEGPSTIDSTVIPAWNVNQLRIGDAILNNVKTSGTSPIIIDLPEVDVGFVQIPVTIIAAANVPMIATLTLEFSIGATPEPSWGSWLTAAGGVRLDGAHLEGIPSCRRMQSVPFVTHGNHLSMSFDTLGSVAVEYIYMTIPGERLEIALPINQV